MEFKNKIILITGAATGIGRATAKRFVEEGAIVGINHLNQHEEFKTLVKECKGFSGSLIELNADVSKKDSVYNMLQTLIQQTNQLDILINNAGLSIVKPFLELDETEWDNIINTDLKSVFLCCQASIPHLQKENGVIINIASELAYTGRANFSAYTAAKGGVISLTRSLAQEFAETIRINAVAPGPTKTPLLDKENNTPGHEESLDDIPLKRYAEPEEIAETILFLASDKARYYCGDVLSPNGGTLMR